MRVCEREREREFYFVCVAPCKIAESPPVFGPHLLPAKPLPPPPPTRPSPFRYRTPPDNQSTTRAKKEKKKKTDPFLHRRMGGPAASIAMYIYLFFFKEGQRLPRPGFSPHFGCFRCLFLVFFCICLLAFSSPPTKPRSPPLPCCTINLNQSSNPRSRSRHYSFVPRNRN